MDEVSPLPTYIAWSVGYHDDAALIAWAREYRETDATHADDARIAALAGLDAADAAQAGALLRALVDDVFGGYDVSCDKGEMYALHFFTKRLESYAAGHCEPQAVCRMTSRIQGIFGDAAWLKGIDAACATDDRGAIDAAVAAALEG